MGIQVKYTIPPFKNTVTGEIQEGGHAYLALNPTTDMATYSVEPFTFNTREEAEAALLEYCSRDTWNSPTLEQILAQTLRRGDTLEFIEV